MGLDVQEHVQAAQDHLPVCSAGETQCFWAVDICAREKCCSVMFSVKIYFFAIQSTKTPLKKACLLRMHSLINHHWNAF